MSNMKSQPSAASEEKPDFPRFASEDDTEICDLLLTLDNVSIYSDDCKERAFVPSVCFLVLLFLHVELESKITLTKLWHLKTFSRSAGSAVRDVLCCTFRIIILSKYWNEYNNTAA